MQLSDYWSLYSLDLNFLSTSTVDGTSLPCDFSQFRISLCKVPIYNKLVFAKGVCDGHGCLHKSLGVNSTEPHSYDVPTILINAGRFCEDTPR